MWGVCHILGHIVKVFYFKLNTMNAWHFVFLPEAEVGWWIRIYVTLPQVIRTYHCMFHLWINIYYSSEYSRVSRFITACSMHRSGHLSICMEEYVYQDIYPECVDIWIYHLIFHPNINPDKQKGGVHWTLAVTERMKQKLREKIFISPLFRWNEKPQNHAGHNLNQVKCLHVASPFKRCGYNGQQF